MYDYRTPQGYGDYFYTYVYSPAANGLLSGKSYSYIPVEVQDGAFILRAWAGAESCLASAAPVSSYGTIQIYDAFTRVFFDLPTSVFAEFATGTAVLPEKEFPSNSALRFDLNNTALALDTTSTVPVSQLAFYGVRRVRGVKSDPTPSVYKYREIDFSIPFTFNLTGNGTAAGPGPTTQYVVQIQDFDFELRRMEYGLLGSASSASREYGDDESVVLITAAVAGSSGNNIVMNLDGPPTVFPANQPESVTVTVSGGITTIRYNPATDGAGNVIYNPPTQGTNTQMVAALNAAAGSLITASLHSGPATASGWGKIPSPAALLGGSGGSGTANPNPLSPEFQFTLYDSTWRARSNAPVNCNRIMHYGLTTLGAPTWTPMNYYPAPGILYPINGVIRFDIASLIPASASLPTVTIVFKGVNRIPC